MPKVAMKVVVDDAHLESVGDLEKKLRDLGVEVEDVIPEIGVVFGSAEDEVVEKVRNLKGVARAEKEHTYRVPPMSEDTPQ